MNWYTFKNYGADAIALNNWGEIVFYDKWNGITAIGNIQNSDECHRYIKLHICTNVLEERNIKKALKNLLGGDPEVLQQYTIRPIWIEQRTWKTFLKQQPPIQIQL